LESLKKPPSARGFLLISYSMEEAYFEAKSLWEKLRGKFQIESKAIPGSPITEWEKMQRIPGTRSKVGLLLQRIHREELPVLKKEALEIQNELAKKDATLTLQPGYLNPAQVVLASGNEDTHKIYLYQGVYAEVLYEFRGGDLSASPTAPEFFQKQETTFIFRSLHEDQS